MYNVYVTNYVGNEGTKALIELKRETLENHFSKDYLMSILEKIKDGIKPSLFINNIYDKEEIGKGGFLTALWKILDRDKLGVRYDLSKVPILQGTIEISNFFDINPYRLFTKDSYIILSELDLPYYKIGETNDKKQRVRVDGETEAFLTKDYKDEIDKIIKNYTKNV